MIVRVFLVSVMKLSGMRQVRGCMQPVDSKNLYGKLHLLKEV